jgi:hypothetical protein
VKSAGRVVPRSGRGRLQSRAAFRLMATMPPRPPRRLGGALLTSNWNGAPLCLGQNDQAQMAQTPNGSLIFAWQNMAQMNNDGALLLTAGGQALPSLDAPWGVIAPSILVRNWQANNLNVTNNSNAAATPIRIQAYGPGMPGQTVKDLPSGTPVTVQPGDTLTAIPDSNNMQLKFEASSGQLALFAAIGGQLDASGNNAYVFAVNFPQATRPPGYTQTTTKNNYSFSFSWNTRIYVAYFGAGNVIAGAVAAAPTVTLLSL